MVYVVTLETPPEVSAEARTAQREALRDLASEGILLLAGPFTDGRGGMAILRASSLEDARVIYQKTPFGSGGEVKWSVREWDARAGTASPHFAS
jgi:uncharacterized protein